MLVCTFQVSITADQTRRSSSLPRILDLFVTAALGYAFSYQTPIYIVYFVVVKDDLTILVPKTGTLILCYYYIPRGEVYYGVRTVMTSNPYIMNHQVGLSIVIPLTGHLRAEDDN